MSVINGLGVVERVQSDFDCPFAFTLVRDIFERYFEDLPEHPDLACIIPTQPNQTIDRI